MYTYENFSLYLTELITSFYVQLIILFIFNVHHAPAIKYSKINKVFAINFDNLINV